ncbi:hypothetical protein RB598_004067 [Gaeumannomyces tritici]
MPPAVGGPGARRFHHDRRRPRLSRLVQERYLQPVRNAAAKIKDHVVKGSSSNNNNSYSNNGNGGHGGEAQGYDSASNRTLGIESIQFINMDYRYVRLDALAIQCYMSDIEVKPILGFPKDKAGSEVVGFPPTSNPSRLGPPEVATWRAHANVWQQMLMKRSPAVLIMESDTVWDTQLRRIIGNLNGPFLDLLHADNPNGNMAVGRDDPWAARSGLWDILSLGQCSGHWKEGTGFRLYRDEFAAAAGSATTLAGRRVVYRAGGMVCLTGYVVSLRGAAKLLARTAINLDQPVDIVVDSMMKGGGLVGYNTQRQPVAQWVYPSGLGMEMRGANSDIRPNGSESSQSGDGGSRAGWPDAERRGSVWDIKPQYAGVDFPDFGLGHARKKIAETKKKLHF